MKAEMIELLITCSPKTSQDGLSVVAAVIADITIVCRIHFWLLVGRFDWQIVPRRKPARASVVSKPHGYLENLNLVSPAQPCWPLVLGV